MGGQLGLHLCRLWSELGRSELGFGELHYLAAALATASAAAPVANLPLAGAALAAATTIVAVLKLLHEHGPSRVYSCYRQVGPTRPHMQGSTDRRRLTLPKLVQRRARSLD